MASYLSYFHAKDVNIRLHKLTLALPEKTIFRIVDFTLSNSLSVNLLYIRHTVKPIFIALKLKTVEYMATLKH